MDEHSSFSIMPINLKKKLCNEKKVIFLGSAGVGKTRLILRLAGYNPAKDCRPRLGADFVIKMAQVKHSVMKIQLWDTAGQEQFGTSGITNSYFRHAHGAILVYDVTDRSSFQALSTWAETLEQYHRDREFSLAIVGNKCDVDPSHRQVSTEEGENFARLVHASFYECSGLLATQVVDCFDSLVNSIYERSIWTGSVGSVKCALSQLCAPSVPEMICATETCSMLIDGMKRNSTLYSSDTLSFSRDVEIIAMNQQTCEIAGLVGVNTRQIQRRGSCAAETWPLLPQEIKMSNSWEGLSSSLVLA